MSAGASGEYPGEPPIVVHRELALLAPAMQRAVAQLLEGCAAAGLEAMVWESYRSPETARLYYARGRTQIPPHQTCTNAPTNELSWHGYGLAVDIIHATKHWDAGPLWFARVASIAESQRLLKWGGRWTIKDLPHFQWGRCKASPSDTARSLLRSGGVTAVWIAVGAST